jgi:uncharacterized small protein (DUF1192 family)
MDLDDLMPRKAKPAPKDLSGMGIAELEAHIAELQAEIERTRAEIARKQAHKAAVEGLFKGG